MDDDRNRTRNGPNRPSKIERLPAKEKSSSKELEAN
jgi:hypothetical protein